MKSNKLKLNGIIIIRGPNQIQMAYLLTSNRPIVLYFKFLQNKIIQNKIIQFFNNILSNSI